MCHLLDAEADLELSNSLGDTPLICAAMSNHLCVAAMLVEAKANVAYVLYVSAQLYDLLSQVNAIGSQGNSALIRASMNGHLVHRQT